MTEEGKKIPPGHQRRAIDSSRGSRRVEPRVHVSFVHCIINFILLTTFTSYLQDDNEKPTKRQWDTPQGLETC